MRSSAWANEEARANRRRGSVLLASILLTTVLASLAWWRWPDVGQMVRMVPADDPAVVLDRQVNADFGMRNPVIWVVAAREGTVWTPELLHHVQALTREVLTVPGVIATDVLSLASPNVRDVEVTEDTLGPVYLMGQVPETPEAVAAVRQRVERNPNYHGVLVTLDGRAAMVVANFRDDADAAAVATAALAIRDRHRDTRTEVYVSGQSIVAASIRPAMARMALATGLIIAVAAIVLLAVAGGRALLAAGLAIALTAIWGIAALIGLQAFILPWVLQAFLAVLPITAAFALGPPQTPSGLGVVTAAMVAGFGATAFLSDSPLRAFGTAGTVLVVASALAAAVTSHLVPIARRPAPRRSALVPGVAAAASLLIAAGGLRLESSFGLFGYGMRYLPTAAVADLRGVARHFPPPTALVVRARGAPGFLASAAVMDAFEGVTAVAGADPAVVRALSLADLVKMIHRTFNDNQPEFSVVPRESALISRYLTLSYAPQFRTFVDRAFSQAAIWVYLSGDRVSDLTRVRDVINAQLAAHPIPNGEVDRFGGDGAVVLAMARLARGMALASLAGLLAAAIVLALFRGPVLGLRTLIGGLAAGAVAAGGIGWLGFAVDLVSLPCIIAAGAAGVALTALRRLANPRPLSGLLLALAIMSAALLCVSGGAANMLGATLLGAALAPAACAASRR